MAKSEFIVRGVLGWFGILIGGLKKPDYGIKFNRREASVATWKQSNYVSEGSSLWVFVGRYGT